MRPASLRFRLLLVVALVVVASVSAVGYVVRGVARSEFDTYVRRVETEVVHDVTAVDEWRLGFEELADEITAHVRAHGLTGIGAVLASLERNAAVAPGGPGPSLIVVVPDGSVIAEERHGLAEARAFLRADGGLQIDVPFVEPEGGVGERSLVIAGPRRDLVDDDGDRVATLHLLPDEDTDPVREDVIGPPPEQAFKGTLDERSLVTVVVVGGLALLVAAVLIARALAPLGRLTDAAHRMESGDLAQRVAFESGDEIGELGHAFDSMAESLQRTEELRRNLVSDVAHELRTPLTRLRARLEAIQDGLAPADANTVDALHDETLLLGRLIDDLQDLALAEARRLRLALEDFDARAEVDAVATASAQPGVATPHGAGPTIDVEVPENLQIHADRQRFRQVIGNLLDNARAHTPSSGRIVVDARRAGGHVELSVVDDGRGIAREHLTHVFDRFYRTDPSRERRTGGAGLGLAIVKHLVEAMGGRVNVTSELGAGSTFTVTLPAGDLSESEPAANASVARPDTAAP